MKFKNEGRNRARIAAATVLAYASIIFEAVLNRRLLLQSPGLEPIRISAMILGWLVAFVCLMYLVFAAISGAPDDESRARKYWAKWQMLIWVPWWCMLVQKGIVEFRTKGFGDHSFLAALVLLTLVAVVAAWLYRRTRSKKSNGNPASNGIATG